MDRGAWEAAVHGVAKSRTRLSDFTHWRDLSDSRIGAELWARCLPWCLGSSWEPRPCLLTVSSTVWSRASRTWRTGAQVDVGTHFQVISSSRWFYFFLLFIPCNLRWASFQTEVVVSIPHFWLISSYRSLFLTLMIGRLLAEVNYWNLQQANQTPLVAVRAKAGVFHVARKRSRKGHRFLWNFPAVSALPTPSQPRHLLQWH